ncbi:MAG TPA: FtsX-like permease family protein [Streptosporangiaceae bacterium]|nr:FtsX-like permease family protein [Streptosporangiaceae bacterium]
MGAILLVLAARARRYWRSWMLLGLVAAIGTGVVLAAVTAGHRADSAFPRFAASHGYDAIVYSVQPLPKLGTLREVSLVTPIRAPFHGQPWCSCGRQIDQGDFAIREVPAAALGRVVKLVSGRMPDQASVHETLASFTLQRDYGIGPGTVIRIPMAAASQWGAVLKALAGGPVPKPAGPTIALRVVGVAAAESEFPSGQGAAYDLYPTQAFAAATRGSPALPFYYVRLRHGPADFARFEAAASGRSGAGVQDLDATAAAITASIRPQAVGWWVLAALAAVVAAVVAAQALARQTAAENTDQPILSALGLSSRQSAALGMLRTLIVALAGVGGGVVLATLASAFAPVGEARLADPAPGLTFDWPVAGLGAVAAVAVVLALGAAPALRGARTRGSGRMVSAARPSVVGGAAAVVGAPTVAVLGIRQALERGRGTRAVPVRTALAGTILAVAGLCATAVLWASLSRLTASPELYGDPFQAFFSWSGPGGSAGTGLLTGLERDPAIDRITLISAPAITVNQVSVRGLAAAAPRGPLLLSAADGRLPAGRGEVALGASTMRQARAHLGSVVQVGVTSPGGAARSAPFRVVGLVSFPSDFGTGGLGTGAALTTAGYTAAQCPPSPAQPKCRRAAAAHPPDLVLVHAVPGTAGSAALARHIRQYPGEASRPTVPTALVNFGESANFPLLLGGVVTLCGAATLAHLLAVSVWRRRRDSGLLKALGFVRGQVAAVVFWQAATVAVVGIVVGVPLGLVAGRAVWRVFALDAGVVAVPVLPGWLIAALAAGVLVAAIAIAIVPAVAAARSPAGRVLHAE